MANGDLNLSAEFVDLAARLASCWAASVASEQGRVRLQLSHELSPGAHWVVVGNHEVAVELSLVREWLRNDEEIIAIAHAPMAVPHARLLRELRLLARGFQWSNLACRSLATLLQSESLLTEEEAAWFGVFTGIGAPLDTPSRE